MTARATFTQADVARAIRGAKAAGCQEFQVEIAPDGRLSILVGATAKTVPAKTNPWDADLP